MQKPWARGPEPPTLESIPVPKNYRRVSLRKVSLFSLRHTPKRGIPFQIAGNDGYDDNKMVESIDICFSCVLFIPLSPTGLTALNHSVANYTTVDTYCTIVA